MILSTVGILEVNKTPFTVGQSALGGIIAYILQSGDPGYDAAIQHGFVVSSNGLTARQRYWGCSGLDITGLSATLGQGSNNTTTILSQCPYPQVDYTDNPNPAYYCNALVEGGYSDWFLPNYNEVFACYSNRSSLGSNYSSLGVGTVIWTSEDSSGTSAYILNHASFGIQKVTFGKNTTCSIDNPNCHPQTMVMRSF
jgi:hypothetical protein